LNLQFTLSSKWWTLKPAKSIALFMLCGFLVLLPACGSHTYHIVKRGETLYAISWLYGHDYRKIAHWNGVKSPYVIKEGQRLSLLRPQGIERWDNSPKFGEKIVKSRPRDGLLKGSRKKSDKLTERAVPVTKRVAKPRSKSRSNKTLQWRWPTLGGQILQTFDATDPGKSGLDIGGRNGQSIFSVSSGRVVYSGSGLPRYGKLIIVKHDNVFLSAYAHNQDLLVKEGDWVKLGQIIARMGDSGTSKVKLHFEIRRNGHAINPLGVLPKRRP